MLFSEQCSRTLSFSSNKFTKAIWLIAYLASIWVFNFCFAAVKQVQRKRLSAVQEEQDYVLDVWRMLQ